MIGGTAVQTSRRVWIARIVALAADFVQIVALPFFAPGAASPANNVLDFVVAAAMVYLLGWHWAFLPTLVAEMTPLFDLVPSWTAAVFIVTRGAGAAPPPLPPAPPEKHGP